MNLAELLLQSCPEIESGARYWFIRTKDGQYFTPFKEHSIIGLDWDGVKASDLDSDFSVTENVEALEEKIKKAYPEHKRPGLIRAHLVKLRQEISIGDYVVIPNFKGATYAIGRITHDGVQDYKLRVSNPRTHIFRTQKILGRKVEWLKDVAWADIDPRLERSFRGQQTVVEVSDQAHWVDILLNDFFKKGDEYHFVLKIETSANIRMKTLRELMAEVENFEEVGAKETGLEVESDITAKVNLNSPGEMELISLGETLIFVAFAVYAMTGGTIRFKYKDKEVKLGSERTIFDGIGKLMDAYSRLAANKSVRAKFDALEVLPPETIVKMLKESLPPAIEVLPPPPKEEDNEDDET